MTPLKQRLSNSVKIFWVAGKRLIQEKFTYQAAALAYTTLLALVPLLSTIVSVIAVLPLFTTIVNLTRSYILTNLIPTSSSEINNYLDSFTLQATHLPKISLIFLFLTTLMLIITIKHTLGNVWKRSQKKKKFSAWIGYWLAVLLIPVFVGLSALLSSYLFSTTWFINVSSQLGLTVSLLTFINIIINTIMFSALYIVVSNEYRNWRYAFLGGFIAALLFDIAKFGFTFYVRNFPGYALIYGALATIPLFLVWLYISWLIILYGALITHVAQSAKQLKLQYTQSV